MIDIDLTDIAHGGACVGRAPDGRVVFARFGLPGERVRVEVTGERSSLVRGDVVEVLSGPSEHRVQTAWPEAGPLGVGGAELGHVAFDFQARWKTHVLRATLARVGGAGLAAHLADRGVDCRVRPMDGDARTGGWATRTRVEFVVGEDGTPSMHREGTHDLLPVSGFPLAVADVGDLDLFGAWRRAWRPGQRVRAVAPSGSDPVIAVGQTCWWAPGFRADRYVREDVVVDGRLYPYR
ncbi:MAG: TRAM domain-containing protein, partial [Peptidiphaga sp.]